MLRSTTLLLIKTYPILINLMEKIKGRSPLYFISPILLDKEPEKHRLFYVEAGVFSGPFNPHYQVKLFYLFIVNLLTPPRRGQSRQ